MSTFLRRQINWIRPQTMKAVRVNTIGAPSVLQVENIPVPEIRDGECLIMNTFAGLNFIDTYYRSGLYAKPLPFTVGVEGAGIIVETSESALRLGFDVGRAVVYFAGESYAEYTVVSSDKLIAVPDDFPLDIATALTTQGCTAHYLVSSSFPLKQGDTCLVHAASGGTGQLVVKMAKLRGATVIATVSSDEKAQIARACGADYVIKYTDGVVERVMELTQNQGVDVVYDGVGLSTWQQSLQCAKVRGYCVFFGNASGPIPPVNLGLLAAKSLFITRPKLGDYMRTPEEISWRIQEVFGWIKRGEINVVIDRLFSLEEAEQGHQYIESRQTLGKVLFKIRD
jgi:NADPH2:quinone reductase